MKYNWQKAKDYQDIIYEKMDGIAKITINRPEVRNAFRPETVKEMKTGSFLIFFLAFLLGLYLVYDAGIFVLIIGILSIAAGVAYTNTIFPAHAFDLQFVQGN